MSELTCFKTYDIRGEINVNIDSSIAYRIGRAVAQHLDARSVVVGFDARATSPTFAAAAARGVMDAGADVLNIGLAGTEEMYWAVTEFDASAGIEVTASHNPINFNGMKIVKSHSRPLEDKNELQVVKSLAESQAWVTINKLGQELDITTEARSAYIGRVLSLLDVTSLKPLKIVVNSGNGAAGPTFDAIAEQLHELSAPLEFIRVHHEPNASFPNGIPNPLLPQNRTATAEVVKETSASFGVAFDGDFDRCFFFDESGQFIPGEYVVSLLASIFLEKEAGAKIVHDPRVIWNIQDIVASKGGIAVQSKTGHKFIKEKMRAENAVYGGEMSAHHYFRDFAYCDSGMIPWLLVAELISKSGHLLGELVKNRFVAFPSSGEANFLVEDPSHAIDIVLKAYRKDAISIDETDGISLSFNDWRFNLRQSNTEPLVRLNIETKGEAALLENQLNEITKLLGGAPT